MGMKPNDIVEILIQADGPVRARDLLEVSLHLPRRGTRWVATFRDERGRQTWRSTGLRDRESALVVGQGWEADAKRKRAELGVAPPRLTVRVRPTGAARQQGCLTQKEVAVLLKLSERAVRQIEKDAIEKLRRHPLLQSLWREWGTGEVEEAASLDSKQWALSRAEIAAVYGLARSSAERQALRKVLALTQGNGR
jgi:hypothetical protein